MQAGMIRCRIYVMSSSSEGRQESRTWDLPIAPSVGDVVRTGSKVYRVLYRELEANHAAVSLEVEQIVSEPCSMDRRQVVRDIW